MINREKGKQENKSVTGNQDSFFSDFKTSKTTFCTINKLQLEQTHEKEA